VVFLHVFENFVSLAQSAASAERWEGGPMLPSKALERARDLIATGWCQGCEARDEEGLAVDPADPRAAAWSLLGALRAVTAAAENRRVLEQVGTSTLALAIAGRAGELRAWNDDARRGHDDVLAAYDAAIALLPATAPRRRFRSPTRY
jgi:hypothetical protein